jgi:hypothetical protein
MNPHHFSSQSSTHFDFNIDPNLNLINNEIGDEGEGLSVQQQNIDTPECSVGMGSMGILLLLNLRSTSKG